MRAARSSQGGLTLIELVVGVFLVFFVLLGAGSIYLSTEKSFRTGSRKLLAQREATQLAQTITRAARTGASIEVYRVPNRAVPADSGDGLAVRDGEGAVLARLEWSDAQQTLVDSLGARQTPLRLRGLVFRRDPMEPRSLRFRFQADDERGNLVDMESGVTARN
jgi:Tfp pilus assembly protein PilW